MYQLLAQTGRVLMEAGQIQESTRLLAKGRDLQSYHQMLNLLLEFVNLRQDGATVRRTEP